MCTPTLWEQGTVILILNVSYSTYHISEQQIAQAGNTSDCGVYTCLESLFFIADISLSGYGGKVSFPNVV